MIVMDRLCGPADLGIGEALPIGNVITPRSIYEREMNRGKIKVKIYRVVGVSEHDMLWANYNWVMKIKGRPYNFMGYPRLMIKSLFFDWSDIKPTNKIKQLMKWIGDSSAGWEWAEWCTEGIDHAYRKWKPFIDIFQTENATPLTGDQVAGICPRKPGKKIMLEEVPDAIIMV